MQSYPHACTVTSYHYHHPAHGIHIVVTRKAYAREKLVVKRNVCALEAYVNRNLIRECMHDVTQHAYEA